MTFVFCGRFPINQHMSQHYKQHICIFMWWTLAFSVHLSYSIHVCLPSLLILTSLFLYFVCTYVCLYTCFGWAEQTITYAFIIPISELLIFLLYIYYNINISALFNIPHAWMYLYYEQRHHSSCDEYSFIVSSYSLEFWFLHMYHDHFCI